MHDPIYRLSVAYQNVGYNQPTADRLLPGRRHVAPAPARDRDGGADAPAVRPAGKSGRGSPNDASETPKRPAFSRAVAEQINIRLRDQLVLADP